MKPMSVSVVIPAYRASRTIGRAVESLLAQVRPPDEILVVDDGSPDDLAAALAPYGDGVTLIRKPNGGAASARNLGIERALGDLIAFLDADDYWEPMKLERQLGVLDRHPEVVLVASRYYSETPGGRRREHRGEPDRFLGRVLTLSGPEAFLFATTIWTTTIVVRRRILAANRFVPGLEPAEDRDLWARLVTAGPVFLLSEPLATAVLEPGSLSRSNADTDCGNMLRVVRRNRQILGPRGVRAWEAATFRRWAANHLGRGCYRGALGPAWSRLRLEPGRLEAWWVLGKCLVMGTASRLGAGSQSIEPGMPVGTREGTADLGA